LAQNQPPLGEFAAFHELFRTSSSNLEDELIEYLRFGPILDVLEQLAELCLSFGAVSPSREQQFLLLLEFLRVPEVRNLSRTRARQYRHIDFAAAKDFVAIRGWEQVGAS
jgi:hypothetical protein